MKKNILLPIVFGFFVLHLWFAAPVVAQGQTNIVGPAGSIQFGTQVVTLPNGNFVVTDPNYNAPGQIANTGRVYLYNGTTLALINTMTGSTADDGIGSGGITVLANGNYVVSSPGWNGGAGAVTQCNSTTGCPATITAANSLVGSTANDAIGSNITALPNGNYVTNSQFWDNGAITDVGAVTFCNGTTGCTGAVTATNSLVGSTANDSVGNAGIKL